MDSLNLPSVADQGILDLFYVYLRDFLTYAMPLLMISFSLIAVSLLIALTIRSLAKGNDDDDDDYKTYYY